MKRIVCSLATLFLIGLSAYGQETDSIQTSSVQEQADIAAEAQRLEAQIKEQKAAEKAVEKAAKEQKKAEKAQKKSEKEAKKLKRLANTINKKRKSIDKDERQIVKLQSKLSKDKIKGKLSPVEEMEMNQKINKLKLGILKEKEKLADLERKQ